MSTVTYRATVNCMAGGFYRHAGEEFCLPRLKHKPDHLEEVGECDGPEGTEGAPQKPVAAKPAVAKPVTKPKPTKGGKPAVAKAAHVTPADIGVGEPTPAHTVTSSDLIKP